MQEPFFHERFLFFYPKSVSYFVNEGEWIYLSITTDFLELIPQQIHSQSGKKLALF